MCGRFALAADKATLEAFYEASVEGEVAARYNIAPQSAILAIVDSRKTGKREAHHLRWGLVPSWAKEAAIGAKMINARSESVFEKPAFRHAIRHQRCIIPASGFYEWHTQTRQPYFIKDTGKPFLSFAGLWEKWKTPEGQLLLTCSILTHEAAGDIAAIHHREPVMLQPEVFASWLLPETNEETVRDILAEAKQPALAIHAVSKAVNRPANNTAELLNPA